MRSRHLAVLVLMLILLTGVQLIDPMRETYIGMFVQNVAGKPLLLLQEKETFSIYAPTGDKTLDGWKPLFSDRLGTVYGTFEMSGAIPETKPGLGMFFRGRYAVMNVAADSKTESSAQALKLDWPPETAAELNGKLYCFGAKLKEPMSTGSALGADGVLRAARLDGAAWTEVSTAALNDFRFGKTTDHPSEKVGFWLRSVTVGGRIAVIWRTIEYSQTAGLSVEGPRLAGEGDTWISFFDGEKFSPPVAVKNLPAGNASVWEHQGALSFLIQTRANRFSTSSGSNVGAAELWNVSADGSAKLVEAIAPGKNRLGLFAFIAVERFNYLGREHVIRSTWQKFEVQRKEEDGTWRAIENGASGLPQYELERWLYIALGLCLVTVLFGVILAFTRRRQALTVLTKVHAHELLAPLSTRAAACVLDWMLVLLATIAAAQFDTERFIDILPSPLDLPYTPFMLCSSVYFVSFEWFCGTTPGKFAMGLCVIRDDGQWPGIWNVFVRNLAGLYERHPFYLVIAAPMLLFSPRRQRLGDLLSRTVVVQRQGLERVWAQRAAAAVTDTAEKEDLLQGGAPNKESDA